MSTISRVSGQAVPFAAAIFIAAPIAIALWFGIMAGGGVTWDHILANRLVPYTLTTLHMLFVTGIVVVILAIPSAWLVSAYEFPGRKTFEWVLILPIAVPGYVMAYVWANLLNVAGPVQTGLRQVTGLSARDMWFPDVYSVTGLSMILAATLYPYVFLTARAAFTTQSLTTLEAARSLGTRGWRLLSRVALPTAYPALVAGLALALMESAADFGAADHLGIQTLGVGIVRAWSSYGEPATAARLALGLVSIVFLLLLVARLYQGRRGHQQTGSRWLTPTRTPLVGKYRWMATAWLGGIIALTFLVPVTRLVWLSVENGGSRASFIEPFFNSVFLGVSGTVAAFVLAITVVLASRRYRALAHLLRLPVLAGYATPGAVLGLGALFMMKATGLALSGGIALLFLIWIYSSRFASAGIEPMHAALQRAPLTLNAAARSLDSNAWIRFWKVDRPILMPGALAGGLILFVEIIKELPATLMLRPFGWDTLAVRAHAYASDERLAEATVPALLITLAGLGPVILLSRRLANIGTPNE